MNWNKGEMHEMGDEMKAHIKKMMEKLGVGEKMMTDKMMWGMKKSMMGGAMMMKEMMNQGMSEEDSMGMMKKYSDMMMSKDMMEEMKSDKMKCC